MKNNIHSAFRVLKKFRLYMGINIAGLALSLACATIVIRYIHQELTVDSFVPAVERTYILVQEFDNRPPWWGSNEERNDDPAFKDPLDTPAVESSTRFMLYGEGFSIELNQQSYPVQTIVADNNFLEIFPFQLSAGTGTMKAPTDAILTKKMAKLLFGSENPVGNTIKFSTGDILTIIGIIDEPACKTTLTFDILVSDQLQKYWDKMSKSIVRLVPNADVAKLNQDNAEFMQLMSHGKTPMRLQFYSFKKLYFNHAIGKESGESEEMVRQGNSNNIRILLMVAILLLVVGIFNFINIYAVLMLKRSREFGIKKVYGASYKKMFAQIYTENLIVTGISLFLVWFIIEITERLIYSLLQVIIHGNLLFDIKISLLILLLFPLLISIYPVFNYKHSSPITSIKSVYIKGKLGISRFLFLFIQYVVTYCLIVASAFFVKQLYYMLNTELGYRTENIIQCAFTQRNSSSGLDIYNKDKALTQRIAQQIAESPLFTHCSFGDFPHKLEPYIPIKKENGEYHNTAYVYLSQEGINLFGFQLLEGRFWNDSIDQWAQYRMIINETAKKTFGITDITTEFLQPESRLWWSYDMEDMDKNPPYEITGVIKDFKTNHLSKQNVPTIFIYDKDANAVYTPFLLTIAPGKRQDGIAFLQKLYDEAIGTGTFEYRFLEDEIAAMYEEDKQVAHIYVTFALIAILISCLGLFGLSLFDIRQHYRSIALRKVNGATIKDIWPLILKKYVWVLGASFAVGIPLSYYVIHSYLENFAHKAPVSWWLFAGAAGIVMLLSYVTLVWQVRKAVRINPVEVLRSE